MKALFKVVVVLILLTPLILHMNILGMQFIPIPRAVSCRLGLISCVGFLVLGWYFAITKRKHMDWQLWSAVVFMTYIGIILSWEFYYEARYNPKGSTFFSGMYSQQELEMRKKYGDAWAEGESRRLSKRTKEDWERYFNDLENELWKLNYHKGE